MTTASTSGEQRRPGGRTARTRASVHAAVRQLLAAGRMDPTVREASDLSGVHEVTIYRRWGSIEALLLDVATAQLNEEAAPPLASAPACPPHPGQQDAVPAPQAHSGR